MKIKRKLETTTGMLLILVFASGAPAARVVLDKTRLMLHDTETINRSFENLGGGLFKAALRGCEVLAPFDVLAQSILRGSEIIEDLFLGSGMIKFQIDQAIFVTNFFGIAEGGSNFGLFQLLNHSLSRVNPSEEQIPTAALLILVGLIGLIAVKGRRK